MSTTTISKLVMEFTGSTGKTVKNSYNYVDEEVEGATVKSVMQGIIANGDIFENVPIAIKSAAVVTTDTTLIDLDA